LQRGEQLISFVPLEAVIALGTSGGRVKRVNPDYPLNRDEWEVIGLKDDDVVVGASVAAAEEDQLVLISSDAQLLRYSASLVRPQRRAASGVAGMKLGAGQQVIGFDVIPADAAEEGAVVVTCAAGSQTLDGLGTES